MLKGKIFFWHYWTNGSGEKCVLSGKRSFGQVSETNKYESWRPMKTYCVKKLAPYLLGRRLTVRMDHKNSVFLSNSTIPNLVRWRVLLSEFQYQVEHISLKWVRVTIREIRVTHPNLSNHFIIRFFLTLIFHLSHFEHSFWFPFRTPLLWHLKHSTSFFEIFARFVGIRWWNRTWTSLEKTSCLSSMQHNEDILWSPI